MAVDFDALYIYEGVETGKDNVLKFFKIPAKQIQDITVIGSKYEPIKSLAEIRTLRDGDHRYPIGDIFTDTLLLTLLELDVKYPEIKTFRVVSRQQAF